MSDNQSETTEQGSFSSGIIVGVLAGAVGYFLSQTKEGKEMRNKFSNHWHELRNNLIQEGKLSETESEITDYIKAARNKISEYIGDCSSDTIKKRTTKKKTKAKKKIFKGL